MWDSQVHSKVPSGPWPEPLGMTARRAIEAGPQPGRRPPGDLQPREAPSWDVR